MLAVVTAFVLLAAVPAEPPGRFAFRSYASEQGLENLSVLAIVQDREGFLWVATEDGLYRYDGDRFHRFGAEDGLPSNQMTSIALGDDGRLWAGTFRGVALFDQGRFRQVAKSLPDLLIKGLAPAPGGALWVATGAGLFFESSREKFDAVPGWPAAVSATAVWADARGIVAATPGRLYTQKERRWVAHEAEPERIDAVVRDRRGTIWARSAGHLWALADGMEKLEDFTHVLPGSSDTGYLSLDQQGTLWVPTDSGLLYKEEGGPWSVIGPAQGLPASWARTAAEDREGSIWIGVTGLHRAVGRGLWRVYSTREGLPSEVVWTEWRDKKGALYVGTDRGLVRAANSRFELVRGSEGHAIRSVTQLKDGALWMGGSPPELLRIDEGRVDRFPIRARKVLTLLASSRDELFVGTDGGGLLELQGNELVPVAVPGGSVQERFSHVIEDRTGRIWAAGELGLAFRGKNGEWHRLGTADGLRDERTAYLLERRSGDICVAYRETIGFSCFRPTAQGLRAVQHIDASNGLQNARVYLLGEDRNGRLWVGTGQGADVFDAHGTEHFGQARGMAGDDCDANAFLADPNGDVWLGTSTGLARFIGGNYAGPPDPPHPVIVEARVGNSRLLGKELHKVEGRNPALEVHFAGLSFLDEARVQHQVRLLPLEPEWRQASVREARYSALGPGSYVFEVRARMAPGAWSEPARLDFVLLPQWWQTVWFRVSVSLAAAALLGWVVNWRVRRLQQRNRELESQVNVRTGELASANQALRDLAVSDPLTGLKNRRYLELAMPETVAQVMRHHRGPRPAKANADLLLLIIDLDDFKRINDTWGHGAGDRVLQQAGKLVAQICRESDSPVRWGGEEFVVVARNADRAMAASVAERICELFREHDFDVGGGQTVDVTCSVGLAAFPFADLPWEDVIELADHCLYAAKRAGKDCWAMATPSPALQAADLSRRLRGEFAQLVSERQIVLTLSAEVPSVLAQAGH
ncbi:MAG: diguanylate cyclase [Myxococcales bacterium]|nr:diguanylate cyclase [Myxococcales bacterium]